MWREPHLNEEKLTELVRDIGVTLSCLSQDIWTMQPNLYEHRLSHDLVCGNFRLICQAIRENHPEDRLKVTGHMGNELRNHVTSQDRKLLTKTTITAAIDRGAEQIALDIKRRLLAFYPDLYNRALARKQDWDAKLAAQDLTAQHLASIVNTTARRLHRSTDNPKFGWWQQLPGDYSRQLAKAEVFMDQRVKLEIDATPQQAAFILQFLKDMNS